MAKKKAASAKPAQTISRLQTSMKRLQKEAEDLLRRTQKQATTLISKDQRRAVDRLLSQAARLRDDLEKRADRATKDLESRAERFLSTLEKEASKRLNPLLRRLDLPSRQELQTLNRRIAHLERALAERPQKEEQPSAPAGEPSGSPGE